VLGQEIEKEFMEQLRKATEDRLPPELDFDAVTDESPPPDAAPTPGPTNANDSGTGNTFDRYNIIDEADLAAAVAKRFNGKLTANSEGSAHVADSVTSSSINL
jgi:hypothetical protein